jgi:hypothetical protein
VQGHEGLRLVATTPGMANNVRIGEDLRDGTAAVLERLAGVPGRLMTRQRSASESYERTARRAAPVLCRLVGSRLTVTAGRPVLPVVWSGFRRRLVPVGGFADSRLRTLPPTVRVRVPFLGDSGSADVSPERADDPPVARDYPDGGSAAQRRCDIVDCGCVVA